MPTSRPRHVITESDIVARALDEAARHWPADAASRSRLLLHLIEEGYRAVRQRDERSRRLRLSAIEQTAGTLTGAYGANYLSELRRDWPE